MKEIFEQYGSVIIAAIAIGALAVIIGVLLASDGVVAKAFADLVTGFFNKANTAIGTPSV